HGTNIYILWFSCKSLSLKWQHWHEVCNGLRSAYYKNFLYFIGPRIFMIDIAKYDEILENIYIDESYFIYSFYQVINKDNLSYDFYGVLLSIGLLANRSVKYSSL
ncbi:hypothetical protein Anas_09788, partial [Armadillidium nasatum]